ncbi:hypothetical protein ACIBD9_04120 [Micromonospora sp. NPDC050784]|uniref:hypothetical protein n=1 Tax=Micromonospora sp. NPDC050784 TaxID=3364281 RepID=UPI0037A55837
MSESPVTNFLMRPGGRVVPLAQKAQFLEALDSGSDGKSRGWMGVDFGSLSLCHAAAGVTEAVIEFAKGFAVFVAQPVRAVLVTSFWEAGRDHCDYPQKLCSAFTRSLSGRPECVAIATLSLP